jgi:transposase InsO family protein
VRELVMRIRSKMPRLGTRKLYFLIKAELRRRCINLGRDMLFSFLRAERLLIKPSKVYVQTTNSRHWMRKYPNVIKNTVVDKPEQLWVSDITYLRTNTGHCYLSLVTDAYSRKIMGYAVLDNLTLAGPLSALKMALQNRSYNHQLTHHSDRGIQYCSQDYIALLEQNEICISMTENGDPYENALAERINGILKQEFLLASSFKDYEQALQVVKDAVQAYNEHRPHLSYQMLTPDAVHRQSKLPNKTWFSNTKRKSSGFLEN